MNLTGTWERKAAAGSCRLVRNTANDQFKVIIFSNTGTTQIDASSVLTGITSTTWKISTDCLKIQTDANVYAAASTAGPFSNIGSSTTWLNSDDSMTYALTATTILKYNSASPSYNLYHTFSGATFSSPSGISVSSGNVVAMSLSASTCKAYALADNGSALTQFFNHSSTSYDSGCNIRVSPLLSKLLVYGVSSGNLATYFFHLDFANQTSSTITFPSTSVFDPASIFIDVQDIWLYVRQLASGSQTVSGGNMEYVYQLIFNTIVEVADLRNITASDESSYTGTIVRILGNNTLFVLNKHSSTSILVKLWVVFPDETEEF